MEAVIALVQLVVAVAVIAGGWKMLAKANQPGWAIIVPIYNIIVLLKVAGRPVWWIVLLLIPVINFIVLILMWIDIAKHFGKSAGFGIGLALLGFIFVPMLGFGDAQYRGPALNPGA